MSLQIQMTLSFVNLCFVKKLVAQILVTLCFEENVSVAELYLSLVCVFKGRLVVLVFVQYFLNNQEYLFIFANPQCETGVKPVFCDQIHVLVLCLAGIFVIKAESQCYKHVHCPGVVFMTIVPNRMVEISDKSHFQPILLSAWFPPRCALSRVNHSQWTCQC